jgi:hypothetical protein
MFPTQISVIESFGITNDKSKNETRNISDSSMTQNEKFYIKNKAKANKSIDESEINMNYINKI